MHSLGIFSIWWKCPFALSKIPSYIPWQNALIQMPFFKRAFWIKAFYQGISDQRIVIFPTNMNRNRFTEPTSVRIWIGIVCEFQNLQIWIGILFVIWEVFVNNSQIPDIYFFLKRMYKDFFFLTLIYFSFKKIYR